MGVSWSGDSELIRLTLVDYFSGEVLIDRLVYPSVAMSHYSTKYSGVSRQAMEEARHYGTCIMGRDAARLAVWTHVGPSTVVVGHSSCHDLAALRWIHPLVVDSYVIEEPAIRGAEALEKERLKAEQMEKEDMELEMRRKGELPLFDPEEKKKADEEKKKKEAAKPKAPKGSGKLSLKTLARTRLGREIQSADRNGHDSLEDALAARDLVHWHIVNGDWPPSQDDDGTEVEELEKLKISHEI
jgi:DNA polymerase III epsilon subunit-like protein